MYLRKLAAKAAKFTVSSLASTMMLLAIMAGCASYSGRGLEPGVATMADVRRVMGEPAMQWENADSSVQLSYPRGPAGFHSFMVFLGPDGRLQRIENVMNPVSFGRIQAGMAQSEVTRLLGPSEPAWTVYFKARRELVWEWRYCDDWNNASRFDVLFDGNSGTVRSTLTWREQCDKRPCYCSR